MTSDPETDRLASLLAAQLAERAIERFTADLAVDRLCQTQGVDDEIAAEDLVVNP